MSLDKKAKELHDQGFAVIPTKADKSPVDTGWQKMKGAGRVEPNGNFDQRATGIGVNCGHPMPGTDTYIHGFDADCYNKDVSRELYHYLCTELDMDIPYRVGTKPKFLFAFLHSSPLSKMTSKGFTDGTKDKNGRLLVSRIEILGDGQQFVAYGRANNRQYKWHNGELTSTLPQLNHTHLTSFFNKFESLAIAAGMQPVENDTSSTRAGSPDDPEDFMRQSSKPPLDLTDEQVKNLLRRYKATGLDYDRWVEVGMALAHQYRGDPTGYDLWLKWSKPSPKFDAKFMSRKWRSFTDEPGKASITLATVIKRSKLRHAERKDHHQEARKGRARFKVGVSRLDEINEPDWLIKGVVERDTLGLMFGRSGIGKSFGFIDMLMCIAHGINFQGYRVKCPPQQVIYMAGEGLSGIERRIIAWRQHYGITEEQAKEADARIAITGDIVQFNDEDDVQNVIDSLKDIGFENPAIVGFDTVARATAGMDENSASDMGLMIRGCDLIRQALNGATVAGVHHSGKNEASGARGSSATFAGMDWVIHAREIEGMEGGVEFICDKMKDAEPFKPIKLKFQTINLGRFDADGDEMTSAILQPVDEDDVPKQKKKGRPSNTRDTHIEIIFQAVDGLRTQGRVITTDDPELLSEFGLDAPTEGFNEIVLRDEWRLRVPGGSAATGPDWKNLKKDFERAIGALIADKTVIQKGSVIWFRRGAK